MGENVGVVIDFRPAKERQRADHAARYTMHGILALNPEEAQDYFRCAFIMQPENKGIVLNYAQAMLFRNPVLAKELMEKAEKL